MPVRDYKLKRGEDTNQRLWIRRQRLPGKCLRHRVVVDKEGGTGDVISEGMQQHVWGQPGSVPLTVLLVIGLGACFSNTSRGP